MQPSLLDQRLPRFDGHTYEQAADQTRLTKQIARVFFALSSGRWMTLCELVEATGDPAASISAQLRNLRKPRFGAHTIERRARGDRSQGLFEYYLVRK